MATHRRTCLLTYFWIIYVGGVLITSVHTTESTDNPSTPVNGFTSSQTLNTDITSKPGGSENESSVTRDAITASMSSSISSLPSTTPSLPSSASSTQSIPSSTPSLSSASTSLSSASMSISSTASPPSSAIISLSSTIPGISGDNETSTSNMSSDIDTTTDVSFNATLTMESSSENETTLPDTTEVIYVTTNTLGSTNDSDTNDTTNTGTTSEMATSTTTMTTTTAETSTASPRLPRFISAGPLFGPAAGGTIVVVKGENLDIINATKIILGPKEFDIDNQTSDMVRFVTPEVELYKSWQITLKGPVPVPTGFDFNFKRNPAITKLFPTSVLMSGGIKLFVEGSYLDSVAKPVLNLYVRFDMANGEAEEAMFSQVCTAINSTLLECITPNLTLISGLMNSRGKRSLPDTELKIRQNRDFFLVKKVTISIRLGFEFDGYERYQNVTKALPEFGEITVVPDPNINYFNKGVRQHPFTHPFLNITGQDLSEGCTIHDYGVYVSREECVMMQLESDWLVCKLPYRNAVVDNTTGLSQELVIVNIGQYISHEVGFLQYISPRMLAVQEQTTDFALIFGIVAGFVAVALIILVACMIKYKPWEKSSPEASGYQRQPPHPPHFTDPTRQQSNHNNDQSRESQQQRGRGRIPVFNIFKQQGDYLETMGRPPDVNSLKSNEGSMVPRHTLTNGRYMVYSEGLDEGEFPVY